MQNSFDLYFVELNLFERNMERLEGFLGLGMNPVNVSTDCAILLFFLSCRF